MQRGTSLEMRLKALFKVIESEAAHNLEFAAKLAAALGEAPTNRNRSEAPPKRNRPPSVIPDVFKSLQEKGDAEFKFWLRTLDMLTLREIVKQNGFDTAKVSQRWREPDKLIDLVHEQTQSRLKRGSAFLPAKSDNSSAE